MKKLQDPVKPVSKVKSTMELIKIGTEILINAIRVIKIFF
jgi:hypothetical protein